MNILSQSDGEEWMASRQYGVIPCRPRQDADGNPQQGSEGFVEINAHWHIASFELTVPTDGRTQLLLTDRITQWFDSSVVLLWITGGTFPHDAELTLFLKALRCLGVEGDGLYNHYLMLNLARDEDRAILERLLLLMMALNWEGFVLGESATLMVWMGDEIIKLATSQQDSYDQAQAIVEDLELKALQPDFYWWNAPAVVKNPSPA